MKRRVTTAAIVLVLAMFAVQLESPADGQSATGTTIYGSGLGNALRLLVETEGESQTLNVYGPAGEIVAQLALGQDGSSARYLMLDHLGSTRLAISAAGETIAGFDYTPTGVTSNTGAGVESVRYRYRYTGHPANRVVPTYHTPHREYDPAAARFLSLDPRGSNLSPYVYASGNPVNRIDSTGGEDVQFILLDYDSFRGMTVRQLESAVRSYYRIPEGARVEFRNLRNFYIPDSGEQIAANGIAGIPNHLYPASMAHPRDVLWEGRGSEPINPLLRIAIGPERTEVPGRLYAGLSYTRAVDRRVTVERTAFGERVQVHLFSPNSALRSALEADFARGRRARIAVDQEPLPVADVLRYPYRALQQHLEGYSYLRQRRLGDNQVTAGAAESESRPLPYFRGARAMPEYMDYHPNQTRNRALLRNWNRDLRESSTTFSSTDIE